MPVHTSVILAAQSLPSYRSSGSSYLLGELVFNPQPTTSMPGTIYPSNAYPTHGHPQSHSASYVQRRMGPITSRGPVQNSGPNNLPQRRLSSYDSNYYLSETPLHSNDQYLSATYNPNGPEDNMSSHHTLPPQSRASWNSSIQHMNFPPPPPPSQDVHNVWILDCKHCGTFLSNRGMKAVLLLSQNVALFSTDALPINCSAYSYKPDVLRSAMSHSPLPERTCECLTQTLCCHGCGCMIGYMIVSPCTRCISSTTYNNRQTNGHRFVFHSSEVVGSVRHYIPDEPSVMPFGRPSSPISPPPPLSSSLPISDHSFPSPTIPAHYELGSSSSSGSGLFSSAEGDVVQQLRDHTGVGSSFAVDRNSLQRPSRFYQVPPMQNTEDGVSLEYLSMPPPALVDVFPPHMPMDDIEDEQGANDEREELPSLVSSEEEDIVGYQYPFYGGAIPGSAQSPTPPTRPELQSHSRSRLSPPPPLALLATNHSAAPMSIPVPSSVYPHPAQHGTLQHGHTHPHAHFHSFPHYSHPARSLPQPADPSLSPFPTPPGPSPTLLSPASSIHPTHAQEKDLWKLKAGDVLYWHHLQKSGEIPGVEEDVRARAGNDSSSDDGERMAGKEMGRGLPMIIGGR